jgi:uncharacterized protein YecT (DUF1311 family)
MKPRGLVLAAALALTACGPAPSKPAQAVKPDPAAAPAPLPGESLPAGQITAEAAPPLAIPSVPATTAVIDHGAIEARYSTDYQTCLQTGEAAKGVTPAMATCITDEVGHQNRLLNAEYQRVITALPATQVVILRKTERRWINQRDAKCRAVAASGGTIDRLNGPACVLEETVRRTIELEAMAPKQPNAVGEG